jgi:molybdopterin converting factor small subunit
VAAVKFFAQMRDLTGCRSAVMHSRTIDALIDEGGAIYGPGFISLAASCAVWVNGATVPHDWVFSDDDEVAFLPPMSGG